MHIVKYGILLFACCFCTHVLHADQDYNTSVKTQQAANTDKNQTSTNNSPDSNQKQAPKPQIKFNNGAIHFTWSY